VFGCSVAPIWRYSCDYWDALYYVNVKCTLHLRTGDKYTHCPPYHFCGTTCPRPPPPRSDDPAYSPNQSRRTCHHVTVSPCQHVTMSPCHHVIVSPCLVKAFVLTHHHIRYYYTRPVKILNTWVKIDVVTCILMYVLPVSRDGCMLM